MLVVKKCARLVFGLSALAAALSIAACAETVAGPSTVSTPSAAAPAAIVAGAWKLQSLTRSDSTTVTVSDPNRFTLEFLDGGTRLAVRADCNRGAGSYTTSTSTLSVGPLAVTKAYCVETAPLDDEYLRVLGGDSVMTMGATSLELSSSRGTLKFGK
jgi:heat shock protein HslJ